MECENCKRIQQDLDGANTLFSAIERMYPNWHKYRDISEAISIHTSAQDSIIVRLRQDNDQLRAYIASQPTVQADADHWRCSNCQELNLDTGEPCYHCKEDAPLN